MTKKEQEVKKVALTIYEKFSTEKSLKNGRFKDIFIFRYLNDNLDCIENIPEKEIESINLMTKQLINELELFDFNLKFNIKELLEIREELIVLTLDADRSKQTVNEKIRQYLFLVAVGAEKDSKVKQGYTNGFENIMEVLIEKYDYKYDVIYKNLLEFLQMLLTD